MLRKLFIFLLFLTLTFPLYSQYGGSEDFVLTFDDFIEKLLFVIDDIELSISEESDPAVIEYLQQELKVYQEIYESLTSTGALNEVVTIANTINDSTTSSLGIPNVLVENDFNVFFDPSQVVNYGTAYLDYVPGGANWGGISFKILGIKFSGFFNRPYTGNLSGAHFAIPFASLQSGGLQLTNVDYSALSHIPELASLQPINHLDALGGFKLGPIALGMKLTYADNQAESVAVYGNGDVDPQADHGKSEITADVADHQITTGASWREFLFFDMISASFNMGLPSFRVLQNETAADGSQFYTKIESFGTPSYQAIARAILTIGDITFITPVFYNYSDLSYDTERQFDTNMDGNFTDPGEFKEKYKFIDTTVEYGALASAQTRPTDNLKVIYSLGLQVEAQNRAQLDRFDGEFTLDGQRSEERRVTIPAGFSLQYDYSEKFQFRFGINSLVYQLLSTEEIVPEYNDEGEQVAASRYTSLERYKKAVDAYSMTSGIGWMPREDLAVDLALQFQDDGEQDDLLGMALDTITSLSLKFYW